MKNYRSLSLKGPQLGILKRQNQNQINTLKKKQSGWHLKN